MFSDIIQNFRELLAQEPIQRQPSLMDVLRQESPEPEEDRHLPVIVSTTPVRFTNYPSILVKEPKGYIIATNEANEEIIMEVSVNDKFSDTIQVNSDKEKDHYYI